MENVVAKSIENYVDWLRMMAGNVAGYAAAVEAHAEDMGLAERWPYTKAKR